MLTSGLPPDENQNYVKFESAIINAFPFTLIYIASNNK